MATHGYSGTPLATKLGVTPGARLALLSAPDHLPGLLEPLPDGVRVLRRGAEGLDVAVLFTTARADLARRLPALIPRMTQAGGLWVAWPKRASGVATDVTGDVVRDLGLSAGLVDNKVCAVDATWSALRLVRRVRDRT